MKEYDFAGWATRNNLVCSDGRTIMPNAFESQDGKKVPLVWNHEHNSPDRVLGHAILENRAEGVYAYCYFNDSEQAKNSKAAVEHGDIESLSIFANQLKQKGNQVIHGLIREVSLVLAGANPGAYIESVIRHGEYSEEEAIMFNPESIELFHAEDNSTGSKVMDDPQQDSDQKVVDNLNKDSKPDADQNTDSKTTDDLDTNPIEHGGTKEDSSMPDPERTVQDVINGMTDEQRNVLYALVAMAGDQSDDVQHSDINKEERIMKHNVFYGTDGGEITDTIKHSDIEDIFEKARGQRSLKEVVLQHGITDVDYLFPDARNVTDMPQLITRDMTWVPEVLGAVHKTPFSRIKSLFADLTEADARARGYMKGDLKKEQVFTLLKRTTTPQTIYKKQKLERDDVIDIIDFDVVAWIKVEMRFMLDEEIARAILVGDGRLADADDKISEMNIRPIWTDADLYTIKTLITVTADTDADARAKAFIRACVKSRKDYKGSGNPVLFTNEDFLTDCLLLEDSTGRKLYANVNELATALRVLKIVTVPPMEGLTRSVGEATHYLMGIIVNLTDYNLGADKGGAVSLFDDFDIDYNAMKYLIETRCSGALVKPYSAITVEYTVTGAGGNQ